ncbi:MAG: M3 family oligoendopeptidase [Simkaniaceae bacterium]
MALSQKWDLAKIFSEGTSSSPEFLAFLQKIVEQMATLEKQCREQGDLTNIILDYQRLLQNFREAESYVVCLAAQDISDEKALAWQNKIASLSSRLQAAFISLEQRLLSISDMDFSRLLKTSELNPIAFPLEEIREFAKEKQGPVEEGLISDLSVDGYHGWSALYDLVVGEMKFPFQGKELSFGQIENKVSDADRTVRKDSFSAIHREFHKKKIIFAEILNHIGGFRLEVYKHRSWTSYLKEPLQENRMFLGTLEAMWQVVEKGKAPLLDYLKRKAALLNVEKLAWHDLEAPLSQHQLHFSYDEAAAFIVNHFKNFSPKMAAFAEKALHNHWIEAEDREGKKPGGFCIDFPISRESRIFMTFSGTFVNVSTLAHELGHAFHSEVIHGLPELAAHYRMNLAETASTMAEMIVIDAAIKAAKSDKEKAALLDDKISRAVAFLMNLHARFLFECSFYEARQNNYVSAEELNDLMEKAQKKAYKDSLSSYHPLFWAAKLHFYFTDVPFYNFPYTFGYLFSLSLYELAKKDQHFEEKYISLLQDSGRMTTEQLAEKHLHADLGKPDFWQKALDLIHQDIQQFLRITERL